MSATEKFMWWGYLHSNGTIQCKRWFGDVKDYTEDCEGNDFVVQVVTPFPAESREEAMTYLQQRLAPVPVETPKPTECPTPWGHALWQYMHDQHGLTLLETELQEIVRLATHLTESDDN